MDQYANEMAQWCTSKWVWIVGIALAVNLLYFIPREIAVRRHNRAVRGINRHVAETIASIPGDLARAGSWGSKKKGGR